MVSPQKWRFVLRTLLRLANEIPCFEFDRRRFWIERNSDRVAARIHRLQLFFEHPAHHHDAAVALTDMLLGMDGHCALADLRLVITGELLVLGLGHVPPELAVELRAHPS